MDLFIQAKVYLFITWFGIMPLQTASIALNDDSPLFRFGPGAVVELTSSSTNDTYVENSDDFSYTSKPDLTIRSGLIAAYFIPTEHGNYTFSASCTGSTYSIEFTNLKLSTNGFQSGKRELKKGFRYPIKLTFNNPSSCYLTVKFPNGTILSPVDKTYIYRFTDSYDKSRWIIHTYGSFATPVNGTLDDFKTANLELSLRNYSTTYLANQVSTQSSAQSFLVLGYLSTSSYELVINVTCDYICSANFTNLAQKTSQHAVVDSLSPSYTTIELNTTHRTYDVEVFIVGKGRIDILRKYNLLPTSYYTIQSIQNKGSIRNPTLTAINASALWTKVLSSSKLDTRDNWTSMKESEIVCYLESTKIRDFPNITIYTKTFYLTGLLNYTIYKCNAYHYGTINSSEVNIVSLYTSKRTLENVPSAAPTNVKVTSPAYGALKITWSAIPAEHHEGILQYAIFYRLSTTSSWIKLRKQSSLYYTHSNLADGYYHYKISGETGAGYGPYSAEVIARPSIPAHKVEDASFSAFSTNLHFVDKALRYHTTAIYQVTSVENCHKKCSACNLSNNCCCLSFNLQRQGSGGLHICEINHETAENNPADLVKRVGYQYYNVF